VTCGKLFVLCGYVVGISAFVSRVWGVSDPTGFLRMQGVPDVAAARNAGNVRFLFFILTYLSTSILASLQMGVRVLRTKNNPESLDAPLLRLAVHPAGITASFLAVFGVPTVVGIPIMLAWIRYYKRKFGELEPHPKTTVHA
jgi:hypothetical protein